MRGRSIAALCAFVLLPVCLGGCESPALTTSFDTSCDASPVQNGRLRCSFPDGRRFDGLVANGKASGKGEMTFPNGDRYIGEFADGVFAGRGTYAFSSGVRYEGDFVNGMRHGQGTSVWPDGARYTGQFRNDQVDGYGTVKLKGVDYSGTWNNGCLPTSRVVIDRTMAECGFN